ncbi:MAG: histidine ammonia-lyase [candidate division Zixibacteria bacterium]|nr:histidine ammonia-lyase [candidate division Zixibacteria bacterium]
MSVQIGKGKITIYDVQKVARHNEKIELAPAAVERIKTCRRFVDKKVAEKELMYGINTGIGDLAKVALSAEQLEVFQKFLVYSHAAGYGEPLAIEYARAAWTSRVNVLSQGHSGCNLRIVETMVEMLNKGVTPLACEKGSVGACGDLSPMSQLALVMIGEGEAYYQGQRMSAKEAMAKAGIPTIKFEARDGLASINGSNVIAGAGSLLLCDAIMLTKAAEIAAAMTLEALNSNPKAFEEAIHTVRGFKGAVKSAKHLRAIMANSQIMERSGKNVQDAYSLRSAPQVTGAVWDALDYAVAQFETELNGVGDNPIFFPEGDGGYVLTGANFQGTPISYPLDHIGTGITMLNVISERRLNRLLNKALSMGLPAYLTKGAGMFSGMMLMQYTAGALVCENRILSSPASIGSIPAAADQEDFVSMGMTTVLKTRDILKNGMAVIGMELIAAAQAFEFLKPAKPGKGSQAAYEVVRKHVPVMEEDRPLHNDINAMAKAVTSGEVVAAVEAAIGTLN